MELQGHLEELRRAGLGVVAVSYDSREVLAAFGRKHGISYPLLSDVDSAVIKAFGIYNHLAKDAVDRSGDDPAATADIEKYVSVKGARKMMVGTPHPGTFIIDRDGRVTARFFEEFYRERNTAANIMRKLGTPLAPITGEHAKTEHVVINAYQSDADVLIGMRFHLRLDITPQPGLHVYAPGAGYFGYREIKLTLDATPFVRLVPLEYPASETFHFEPLDEHVPVYLKPFTLLQEVVLEASPEVEEALSDMDTLTLNGRLEYQACDDKICFDSHEVPLRWTLKVAQPDRKLVIPKTP